MSSPIRDDNTDERLTYAPPWARLPAPKNDNATEAQDAPREQAPPWDRRADHPDDASLLLDERTGHPDDAPQWDERAGHPNDAPQWDEHMSHRDDAPPWDERVEHPDNAPPWDGHASHRDEPPPWDGRASHRDEPPPWDERADHPNDASQWNDHAGHPRDLDVPAGRPVEMADALGALARAADQVAPRRNPSAKKPFEGDVAMRELRTRLTLDPHLVPEPPPEKSSGSVLIRVLRLFGIGAIAAGTAYVVVLFAFPEARGPVLDTDDGAFTPTVVASKKTDRVVAPATTSGPPVRLALIESRRATVNESVPLGVTLSEPLGQGTLIVSGLAAGTQVSAGAISGAGDWRVPLPELADAAIEPPAGFVGIMDIAIELRSVDEAIMDRSTMRIEWAPTIGTRPDRTQGPARPDRALALGTPQSPSNDALLDREEIAILLERGRSFIADGDLSSARLLLRRAAEAGDARAALLLGSTYDPSMFRQWGVIGSSPDPEQALRWYQRASELGSDEATRRLEPLASDAQ